MSANVLPGDFRIDRRAGELVEHDADLEPWRRLGGERGVGLVGLRNDEGIARLRDRHAIEHRGRVAHGLRLHEVHGIAPAALVHHGADRHAHARRLEPDAAAPARRNADRAADVGAVGDRHDAGDHCGLAAAGRAAGRIALLPRVRRVAEHRALGGGRHRIFRRGGAPDDVDAASLEHVDEIGAGLDRHAFAQSRAELDLAALLVTEHILDEERHAAERAIAEAALVKAVNAVVIKLDHRLDGAVDLVAGGDRGLRQLLGAHLLLGDELGEAEGIVGGIFCKLHELLPAARWCSQPARTVTASRVSPRDSSGRTQPTDRPAPPRRRLPRARPRRSRAGYAG